MTNNKTTKINYLSDEYLRTGCDNLVNLVSNVKIKNDEIDDMKEDFNICELIKDEDCNIFIDNDSDGFHGVTIKLDDFDELAMLFESGQLNLPGFNSIESINEFVDAFERELNKVTTSNLDSDFEVINNGIKNIVYSYSINKSLNLEVLSVKFINSCEYEPEQFPGVVISTERLSKEKYQKTNSIDITDISVSILVFSSGSIVISGATTSKEINIAKDFVENEIRNY